MNNLTKDLSTSLELIGLDTGLEGVRSFDVETLAAMMLDLAYKIGLEAIGDGEVHVSHVCPSDNLGCAAFAARGAQRHEQRQRLSDITGVKE